MTALAWHLCGAQVIRSDPFLILTSLQAASSTFSAMLPRKRRDRVSSPYRAIDSESLCVGRAQLRQAVVRDRHRVGRPHCRAMCDPSTAHCGAWGGWLGPLASATLVSSPLCLPRSGNGCSRMGGLTPHPFRTDERSMGIVAHHRLIHRALVKSVPLAGCCTRADGRPSSRPGHPCPNPTPPSPGRRVGPTGSAATRRLGSAL